MRKLKMGRRHITFPSANCWHFITALIKCDEKANVHPWAHQEITICYLYSWHHSDTR